MNRKQGEVDLESLVTSGRPLLCAAIAGVSHSVCLYPFDTVKTRLQATGSNLLYKGISDCFTKTWKYEGPRGFYKGVNPFMIGTVPIIAASLMGFDAGKRVVANFTSSKNLVTSFCISQAISAGIFALIATPTERIKCLIQIQVPGATGMYKGPMDCLKQQWKKGGLLNMYRGFGATYLRGFALAGVYHPTTKCIYWTLEQLQINSKGKRAILVVNMFGAMISWTLVLPIDTVKTVLQTSSEKTSGFRVFQAMIKYGGVKGLYRGLVPVWFRAATGIVALFVGFDVAASLFMNS